MIPGDRLRFSAVCILALLCFIFFLSCNGDSEAMKVKELDTVTIDIGGEEFVIEVARTPEERSRGLMFRKKLDKNRGMLFVFENDRKLSFWMKNTEVPLSIAYIAKDGTIKEIHDMKPLSRRAVESTYFARYALEVPLGTYSRLGIDPGYKLDLPKEVTD